MKTQAFSDEEWVQWLEGEMESPTLDSMKSFGQLGVGQAV